MAETLLRAKAAQLAQTDTAAALKVARSIKEPWYRVQALSSIAAYASGREVEPLVREALKAALSARDNYQKVAVSAWPLNVLVQRRKTRLAAETLASLQSAVAGLINLANRSDALMLLRGAALALGSEYTESLDNSIIDCAAQPSSWRCDRNAVSIIEATARTDKASALRMLNRLPDNKWRRRTFRRLERQN